VGRASWHACRSRPPCHPCHHLLIPLASPPHTVADLKTVGIPATTKALKFQMLAAHKEEQVEITKLQDASKKELKATLDAMQAKLDSFIAATEKKLEALKAEVRTQRAEAFA
jgi:hypothetical protein